MKLFLTAIICLLCSSVFSADWTTYFKNEKVEIQFQYADCHDVHNGLHQQKIFLRFINLSNQKEEISFTKELTFSNGKTSNADGRTFIVQLNATEEKTGDCLNKEDNALFLFSKQLNFASTELKKFELKNISVKTIQ